jgi:pyruvate dehydrogenase E2 component (dihydrolipoamide acetyltransferase)
MAEVIEVRIPRENVNDETVTIVEWRVQAGQSVEESQVIAEIETSKTVVEITAPRSGFVHFSAKVGSEVAIGATLCVISDSAAAPSETSVATPAMKKTPEPIFPSVAHSPVPAMSAVDDVSAPTSVRLSAAAQRIAKDRGLDLSQFAGRGLVRERDLLALLNGDSVAKKESVSTAQAPMAASRNEVKARLVSDVPVKMEALPRRKLREIKALEAGFYNTLASKVSVACPTRGLRRLASTRTEWHGNATAIILFEVARLLRKFPVFNACYADGQVNLYEDVNIGFAVDAGQGLKVPVIHRADDKTLPAIATQMQEAIFQYMDDELPVEALSRGTFTITDLSGEDVLSFTPLINEGQSAILGIGAETFIGSSVAGSFELILAFDHRLSDGRTAGQFLRCLRDRMQGHEAAISGSSLPEPAATGATLTSLPRLCSRCGRSAKEIEELRGYLIASVVPPGSICSVCLSGF